MVTDLYFILKFTFSLNQDRYAGTLQMPSGSFHTGYIISCLIVQRELAAY
jgi:hypothetical protein